MGRCCTEAYSGRSQTGKSEILSKIINGWKLSSILAKSSILDGRQGSVVNFKLCVGIILWKFLLMKDFKKGWDKFKIIIAALAALFFLKEHLLPKVKVLLLTLSALSRKLDILAGT